MSNDKISNWSHEASDIKLTPSDIEGNMNVSGQVEEETVNVNVEVETEELAKKLVDEVADINPTVEEIQEAAMRLDIVDLTEEEAKKVIDTKTVKEKFAPPARSSGTKEDTQNE
jgi:capsular polysaccharide biosynthesis protein